MKKPVLIVGLVTIPVVLVLTGLYYKNEILSSIGYVIFIFYLVTFARGWFRDQKKNNNK